MCLGQNHSLYVILLWVCFLILKLIRAPAYQAYYVVPVYPANPAYPVYRTYPAFRTYPAINPIRYIELSSLSNIQSIEAIQSIIPIRSIELSSLSNLSGEPALSTTTQTRLSLSELCLHRQTPLHTRMLSTLHSRSVTSPMTRWPETSFFSAGEWSGVKKIVRENSITMQHFNKIQLWKHVFSFGHIIRANKQSSS